MLFARRVMDVDDEVDEVEVDEAEEGSWKVSMIQ